MINRVYQASGSIDKNQSVSLEVDACASGYIKSPITDSDLLEALRRLEPGVAKAVWTEINHVDELGLYRVGYLSDSGDFRACPSSRFEWKELKVWVVPSK